MIRKRKSGKARYLPENLVDTAGPRKWLRPLFICTRTQLLVKERTKERKREREKERVKREIRAQEVCSLEWVIKHMSTTLLWSSTVVRFAVAKREGERERVINEQRLD